MALGHECLRHAGDFPGVTTDLIQFILNQDWLVRIQERVDQYQEEFYRDIQGKDNAPRIRGNIATIRRSQGVPVSERQVTRVIRLRITTMLQAEL